MNLIKPTPVFQKMEKDEGFYYLHEWRKVDHQKIHKIINEIFNKISTLDENYNVIVEKKSNISTYLGDFLTYQDEYLISQSYGQNEKNFNFFVPKLMQGNFYILNNALYVPILMLEKCPIDRVFTDKKDKIYANLNPIYNFTFDFIKQQVFFNYKKIDFDLFFRIIFSNDDEALEKLLKENLITKKDFSIAEKRKFVKFLGFHKEAYFDDIDLAKWIDEYLILSYYYELFNDYYGINGIKEIVMKIVDIFLNGEVIDMANINNRRIIHIEYLIKPLFELYLRLLYGIIDKKNQSFLTTMNSKVIMTTGFTQNLHRGNLYDISIPFAAPLIHKVSQDINIINSGRLPKSWQRNDESAFGIICPITVSAQNTASNIVLTTETMINQYGRIKLSGE